MNLTRYELSECKTQIVAKPIETLEIGCDACGSTWLHEALAGLLHPCPYCEDDSLNFGNDALAEQAGGSASYARDIRGIVRALWGGVIDFDEAFALFLETIQIGLTRAADEGLKSVGMDPADRTPEEEMLLRRWILNEQQQIAGFLDAVVKGSKANGGKLGPLLSRAASWALRYPDIAARARVLARNDPKLKWGINVVRVVKVNCSTCLKLDGKVKRASTWQRRQLSPQNPPNAQLECGGWQCGCGLTPAPGEPMSKGPLPNTP